MFRLKPLDWRFALRTLLIAIYVIGIGLASAYTFRYGIGQHWLFWIIAAAGYHVSRYLLVIFFQLSFLALPLILFVLWRSSPRSINAIIFLAIFAVGVALEKFYGPTFHVYGWEHLFIVLMLIHSIAALIEVYVRRLPKLQLLASVATMVIAIGYWLMQTLGHALAT